MSIPSQLQCPYVVQFLAAEVCHERHVASVICERMRRGCLHTVLHVTQTPMEWNQRLSIVSDVTRNLRVV